MPRRHALSSSSHTLSLSVVFVGSSVHALSQSPSPVAIAHTCSPSQGTPPFPTVLATCPLVQFEASFLPASVHDRETHSCFSLGSQVFLPPESFVTLRMPFVYGVQLNDGGHQPLQPFEERPESTAWICRRTVLQVLSKGNL